VVLDRASYEDGGELAWEGLSHLGTSEVREVLERLVRRIERHLRRCRLLGTFGDGAEPDGEGEPKGTSPRRRSGARRRRPGLKWVSRLARPLQPHALAYDKPLCASLDGFTLHAATRASALHPAGREALLRYVLRLPVAQERVELRPDGLVRITLKRAYTDGTIASPYSRMGALEEGSRREQAVIDAALAERASRRIDAPLKISIATVPDGFVIGEERALINALNGGPGKPTYVPPRPFQKGINGVPTLVQNAETAAQLALIARHAPARWNT